MLNQLLKRGESEGAGTFVLALVGVEVHRTPPGLLAIVRRVGHKGHRGLGLAEDTCPTPVDSAVHRHALGPNILLEAVLPEAHDKPEVAVLIVQVPADPGPFGPCPLDVRRAALRVEQDFDGLPWAGGSESAAVAGGQGGGAHAAVLPPALCWYGRKCQRGQHSAVHVVIDGTSSPTHSKHWSLMACRGLQSPSHARFRDLWRLRVQCPSRLACPGVRARCRSPEPPGRGVGALPASPGVTMRLPPSAFAARPFQRSSSGTKCACQASGRMEVCRRAATLR